MEEITKKIEALQDACKELDKAWEGLMIENSYKLNREKSIELMEKYQKIDSDIIALKGKLYELQKG